MHRCCFLALVLASGCSRSAVALDDEGEVVTGSPTPIALYTSARGCPSLQPITNTAAEMTSKQFGEAIAVVELFYQDECTGLGGQHILAREIDGFRSFWLGGHGCRLLDPLPTGPRFGVVRYNQTAALFRISPDVCIGFPDREPGATSDVSTRALAAFATLSDARAFAATLR